MKHEYPSGSVEGLFTSPARGELESFGIPSNSLAGASVETASGWIVKKIIDAEIAICAIMESRLYAGTRMSYYGAIFRGKVSRCCVQLLSERANKSLARRQSDNYGRTKERKSILRDRKGILRVSIYILIIRRDTLIPLFMNDYVQLSLSRSHDTLSGWIFQSRSILELIIHIAVRCTARQVLPLHRNTRR